MFRPAQGLLLAMALAAPASASYIMTPLSAGLHQRDVAWGQSFALDIVITSDVSDTHTSAVFQVRFTQPGLVLTNYQWDAPYQTGSIFDDSKPAFADLPMPITPSTLQGGAYPPGLNDLELSNVLIGANYGQGTIVRLNFTVPSNYGYTGPIFISLNPDQIASGFNEVPTTAGQVFRLNVAEIPAPGASFLFFSIAAASFARRRR
ncbi:MAG: hypothetical protein JNK58_05430 [Phycisphaerae bacterium]|nr:hypothetical protein [Phycisphaerae bacterium]